MCYACVLWSHLVLESMIALGFIGIIIYVCTVLQTKCKHMYGPKVHKHTS